MKIRGQQVHSIAERLKRKSCQVGACVEWLGSTRNGYGRMVVGSRADGTRRFVSTHRAAYETYKGPIPDGLYVCHTCDNRKCINPEHLWLGTAKDNVADMVRKGRLKSPFLPAPPQNTTGVENE